MKIMILSSHTESLLWFCMDMMKSFLQCGCEVVAVGNEPSEKWDSVFSAENIRYASISVARNGTNPLEDLQTLKTICSLLRNEKPDKIFVYQMKTVIYGCLAARICGFRDVYPLIAGVGSVFYGTDRKSNILRRIMISELRFALSTATVLFFQNNDNLQMFRDYRIISEKADVVMLHGSGVNIDHFYQTPIPEKESFVCIARLLRDKGIMEYLEASRIIHREYPDVKCVLVGPYDTNPTAVSESDLLPYLQDGSVVYVGSQKDVRPFLHDCTAFVLPSYHEGLPKTVLEAMASGRAIITTNAPGCRDTVVDGVNGYIVPVKNASAVAEAMKKTIKNRELTRQMGLNARKIAVETYDVHGVDDIICEVMGLSCVNAESANK